LAVHQNCHLIAVMGGKGGVGKSVFSANLALAFMTDLKAKVLLVDLDQKSCGDQNIITGLRPKKTVAEVCQFTAGISPQNLDQVVTVHPSGLHFIGAVTSPDQTLSGSAGLWKKQISTLSQFYNFIIVDLGCDFNELQVSMIEEASSILTLTTPEVLAVNQTKKVVADLVAKTVPADFFQVVVNNMGRASLDAKLIQQALNRPIIGLIPQDEVTVYSSIQRSTPFMLTNPTAPVSQAYIEIVRRLSGGILQKLKALAKPQGLSSKMIPAADTKGQLSGSTGNAKKNSKEKDMSPEVLLKLQVHSALIREMDLTKDLGGAQGDAQKEAELRAKTQKVISQLVDKGAPQLSREERAATIKQILDEALGLGPLEGMLDDPSVTEVMVNGPHQIYVEKSGKLSLSPITFTSELQLRNVISRIVSPLGRVINETSPYVDARLADGSRVNAIIPPVAIDGSSLTIRKFPTQRITIDDYVTRFGTMTPAMAEFLKISVEEGLNVIISGGTGSGKTTLLNVLSGFIPSNERIVTVEDAAELQLKQDHVVRLETKPKNTEGKGEISIRDLVKNSLRMRPDRIVVGECRDGAALDMLQAMNTGHDGSMTTVHANNARECIARLETLCLMAGMELPAKAIREQVASAVDLIVQISRLRDGSRKIMGITEVVGMQGDVVTLAEIFKFKDEGDDKNKKVQGQFQATGAIPTFIEEFQQRGVAMPRDLFSTNYSAGPTKTPPAAKPVGGATPSQQPTQATNTIKKASGS
jgi:pilus assembly protein CpaF